MQRRSWQNNPSNNLPEIMESRSYTIIPTMADLQTTDSFKHAKTITKALHIVESMHTFKMASPKREFRTSKNRPERCKHTFLTLDSLVVIDESHVTMPQLRAMWGGDRVDSKAREFALLSKQLHRPPAYYTAFPAPLCSA